MRKEIVMDRERAFELLKKYNDDAFHIRHALTVEGRWSFCPNFRGYESGRKCNKHFYG